MAVQAQYGGEAAPACLPRGNAAEGVQMQERMRTLQEDYGDLLAAAAAAAAVNNNGAVFGSVQSDLTCHNGGGGGGGAVVSRKRGRDLLPVSSSVLLPIPTMAKAVGPAPLDGAAMSRLVDSALTSTSGRTAGTPSSPAFVAQELAAELYRQDLEIDTLVRLQYERLRAELDETRKRQCRVLARAVASGAARRLQEKEAELEAARRRNAELEERLRQTSAESLAWLNLARSNEAVAAGLRATLDHLLRNGPVPTPAEGFGDSDPITAAVADDAQSFCFEQEKVQENHRDGVRACKACGASEARVLLLPCRHLCLCKACEAMVATCPVCLASKNASLHIAAMP